MMRENHSRTLISWRLVLIGAGTVYALLSFWTLPWFPFVHSDEVWLASLTREMMETRNPAATEPFFEATPRYPHAIKTLYHLLQAPFLLVSFSHIAARLPSLLAGFAVVGAVYLLLRTLGVSRGIALAATAAAALDPSIVAASHLARQEALLMAAMVAGALATYRSERPGVVAGVIVGVTIFVHPNAFIVSLALLPWVARRRRDVVVYGVIVAAAAAGAVAASFAMDPDFITNYLAFGESVGVTASPLARVFGFQSFVTKLWVRAVGTYYLPPVRAPFSLAIAVAAASVAIRSGVWWRSRSRRGRSGSSRLADTAPGEGRAAESAGTVGPWGTRGVHVADDTDGVDAFRTAPLASLVATGLGIFLIGKYSPPIAVFLVPWTYLQAGVLFSWMATRAPRARRIVLAASLAMVAVSGWTLSVELAGMHPAVTGADYGRTSRQIRRALDDHGLHGRPVLANLNFAFALDGEELLAFHDLAGLTGEEDLAALVERRGIEVVILPETEFDLIYRERPVWNDLYGNPTHFVPALRRILDGSATRVATIEAPVYGMRIVSRWDPRVPPLLGIYTLVPESPR